MLSIVNEVAIGVKQNKEVKNAKFSDVYFQYVNTTSLTKISALQTALGVFLL